MRVANEWYHNNRMILNETKHQAIVLEKTNHSFSLSLKDSLDVFGINIDSRLHFDNYLQLFTRR